MLNIIKRSITFIELAIGIFLPWKLRCRYSEFLMKLEGGKVINLALEITGKQRNFERFFYLGVTYTKEKKPEMAIENLNKALEIDPDNAAVKDIHLALANCYRLKGEQEQSMEAILNSYKKWKKLYK